MKQWVVKYAPKSLKEVVGHSEAIALLRHFISNTKNKAALIYGPTGNGKTSVVYALANEIGYEVLEVNASDIRDADSINSIVGGASKQRSLFAKGKLILVDEVDGLSGQEDRGGVTALANLISESAFPIICTATDPFDKKFTPLRKNSILIEFDELKPDDIFAVLERISKAEGIKYDASDLKQLSRQVGGDLRAAINDLEMISSTTKTLIKYDIEQLAQRNKEETIMEAMQKVLKTTDVSIAISAYENVNEEFNTIKLWLDENLPKEYKKPEDLARAYDAISKADIFDRRIKRRQHWRYYVYISALLSAGVAVAKDEKYKEFNKFGPTTRILKLWRANMKYMKRKSIAEKIAEKTHISTKRAIKDTLPYVQNIFKANKKMAQELAHEFDLDDEEISWLNK